MWCLCGKLSPQVYMYVCIHVHCTRTCRLNPCGVYAYIYIYLCLASLHEHCFCEKGAYSVHVQDSMHKPLSVLCNYLDFLFFVLQLQSTIRDTLRRMSSQRLLSPECVRLFLVLPALILQPPNTELCAVFASSLTSLAAEWRALVGKYSVIGEEGREM